MCIVQVPRAVAPDLSAITINTQTDTRKYEELLMDPRASLSYWDQRGRQGWLTLKGTATAMPGGPKADGTKDVKFTTQRIEIMTYNELALVVNRARPVVLVAAESGGWELEG
jgi:hypothetical protein